MSEDRPTYLKLVETEGDGDQSQTKMPDKPWARFVLALANLAAATREEAVAKEAQGLALHREFTAHAAVQNALNEKLACEALLLDALRADLDRDEQIERIR